MVETTKSPLHFRSVELVNWRNFRKAAVELQPRLFVVGPNASGKSNFLDAFKFLRDIASEGGGLAKAISDRGGVSSLRSLAARSQPAVTVAVSVGANASTLWEYTLSFNTLPYKEDKLRRPFIVSERLLANGKILLERPTAEDKSDREQLTQTYVEQVRLNQDFRELVEFFRSVRYLHVVPQLVRDPNRYSGRSQDPYGWDIMERIGGANDRTRKAWLRRIEKSLRAAVPQLNDLDFYRDQRGVAHLRSKYEHWRPQGAWQSEEVFSDGTLRLIGLLWSMLERTGPLLLEEPELSLNAHVIRQIPSMLRDMQRRSGRQVIVSTHSADLLEDRGIGLAEVVILSPGLEGTKISVASSVRGAKSLLREGLPVSEIVMAATRPRNINQLSLPL